MDIITKSTVDGQFREFRPILIWRPVFFSVKYKSLTLNKKLVFTNYLCIFVANIDLN